MEYVQMTLDDWVGMKRKLQQELLGIKRGFVRIGYILRRIEEQKLYGQDGYKSVAEFAQEEYGLNRSTTSRLISINREYSVGGYSEELRPEYESLGQSQLEEMLGLGEGDRAMVRPETSREDIRELKRFNKEAPETGAADSLVQLVSKFYQDNPEILKAVYKGMPFGEQEARRLAETVNPGGNRSYRKGLYFLMMYEDRVSVKKFGEDPQDLDWRQFYGLTIEAVGEAPPEAACGSPAVENVPGDAKEPRDGVKPEPGEAEAACEVFADEKGGTEEAGATQENSDGEQDVPHEKGGSREQDGIPAEPGAAENGDGEQGVSHEKGSAEKVIAPAQKYQEVQVKEAPLEPAAEEGNREGALPETTGTMLETRKEYLDKLTAEEAAGYIRDEYDRHNLQASYLAYQFQLTKWLLEKVDGQGVTAREQS